MPIKSVKMKILKNKKMPFFLMSQGSLDPKFRVLGQKTVYDIYIEMAISWRCSMTLQQQFVIKENVNKLPI